MVEIAGHKINNWWLVGGGVGVVAVIWFYQRGTAGSASTGTSSTASTSIDPVTGLPFSQDNQTDPLTGMTYLAEAQEYGSVSAAEAAFASGSYALAGSNSDYAGDAGYAYYPTSNVDSTSGTSTSYATNAAWAQAVTSGLVALGYSAEDVSAALGLYFQSHPLGTAPDGASYLSIVQAAVAEYGPPPVGTYSIIGASTSSTGAGTTGGTGTGTTTSTGTSTSTGTGTTTTTTTTNVVVPNVVNLTADNAESVLRSVGLNPSITLDATSNKPGIFHIITKTSPAVGSSVPKGTKVVLYYKDSSNS